MNEPPEVGPIEGREVDPVATGPGAAPVAPAAGDAGGQLLPARTASGSGSGSPVRSALGEIRRSRGKDVPHSRPLPEWVRRFAWVLDDAFPVPGTAGRRVGVDGLIAIVPVAGDVAGIALALVIVVVGIGAGVSIPTVLRMLLNIGFEALVGLIPFVGTVFNMAFKANNRNVALIEADLGDRRRTRRSSLAVIVLTLLALFVGVIMLVVFTLAGLAVLIWLISQLF